MSPDLFPVEASAESKQLINAAVKAAVSAWGALQLLCHHYSASVQSAPAWCLLCAKCCLRCVPLHLSAMRLAGERQLTELEAEDHLAFACEKAPTDDPMSQKVAIVSLSLPANCG